MRFISPLVVYGAALSAIGILGEAADLIRKARTFVGYEGLKSQAKQIAHSLRDSKLFRDKKEVILSGISGSYPVTLTFSNADDTPGLNLILSAPVNFDLAVVPQRAKDNEGGSVVLTHDSFFDSQFKSSSRDPDFAEHLFRDHSFLSLLKRICSSTETFLALQKGKIELSHLTIPTNAVDRTLDWIDDLGKLGKIAESLPGSADVKLVPARRPKRSWIPRVAFVLGSLTLIGSLIPVIRKRLEIPEDTGFSAGVITLEERVIPRMKAWQFTKEEDFDPHFVAWLHSSKVQALSQLPFQADATGSSSGSIYFFRNGAGLNRVLLMNNKHVVYDSVFSHVAGVARIPSGDMKDIEWAKNSKPQMAPVGDGLLVVRDFADAKSAIVFFLIDGRLYSAVPEDFHNVGLN